MTKLAINQKGFTLIELIVVIAILGVLAAIAVPTVSNYLGNSKERSYNAEKERIQTAIDAYLSSPKNVRFQGRRQYPVIGDGQTNQALVNSTSSSTLTDDQNPWSGTSTELWNPLGGIQGADLSSSWTDGDSNGNRDIGGSSNDTWTTVSVSKGGTTYYVDPRYYFVDFDDLLSGGWIDSIPESASADNKPEGSSNTYSGSYSWYIDNNGKVQSLYTFLPSTKGYESGVYP